MRTLLVVCLLLVAGSCWGEELAVGTNGTSVFTLYGMGYVKSQEFFIVRYEGYTWSPCSIDDNGNGTCLAINCGLGGCKTPAETIICKDIDCIKGVIKRRGKDHLTGIFRVVFPYDEPAKTEITRMKLIESFDITD